MDTRILSGPGVSLALMQMDGTLHNHPESLRPVVAQELLEQIGITSRSRITYRPQPAISRLEGFIVDPHAPPDHMDLSRIMLMKNMSSILLLNQGGLDCLKLTRYVQLLTFLDAHAALPPAAHTSEILAKVRIVDHLLSTIRQHQHSLWNFALNEPIAGMSSFPRQRTLCIYAILLRLNLYSQRAHGGTLLDIETSLLQLRKDFQIPDTYDVEEEYRVCLLQCQWLIQDYDAVAQRFLQAAQKEWDGEPVALSDISSKLPTEELSEHTCIVCCDSLTSSGVRTTCGHIYCADCLQKWISGCDSMSHTCPYCRTELFTPHYRVKDPEGAENYQEQLMNLRTERSHIQDTVISVMFFREEMKLQKLWEQETGQGSILLTE